MARTVKEVPKKSRPERKRYNQWECGRLKAAVQEYESKVKERKGKFVHDCQGVEHPKSTLQRRPKGSVTGSVHCSGRKPVLSSVSE